MMKMILKNKYIIIAVLILLLIILFVGYKYINRAQITTYKNDIYSVKYDFTWKISDKSNDQLILKHKTGSLLAFSIVNLKEEVVSKPFNEIVRDVKTSIASKNKDYQLITTKDLVINGYSAKQLLYGNKGNETMVIIALKSNKIYVASYNADNKYFDILLDSAKTIIKSFTLLDEKVVINKKLVEIKTTKISYKEETTSDYKKTSDYEIWNNHYNVKYSIPSIFEISSFNTQYARYKLVEDDIDTSMTIASNVAYSNLYEYISNEDSFISLGRTIKELKDDEKNSSIVITNDKLKSSNNGYIYKISYLRNEYSKTNKYQKIYIMYELDYLRTFVVIVETKNKEISKELVDSIQMKSFIKYGSNVDVTSENGYLKGAMRSFVSDYTSADRYYYTLSYSIPDKYKEVDYSSNKEEWRNFVYEYDEKADTYKYKIGLLLSSLSTIKGTVETIGKRYTGDFYKDVKLTEQPKIIVNGKTFTHYNGQYTIVSTNKKVYNAYLITELESGGIYSVEINSNYEAISTEMIKDFASIEVNKSKYERK